MNALEILTLIVVLPIGAAFVLGGVALALLGGWEDTPGVDVSHRPPPRPLADPVAVPQRPRMVVRQAAHAA